jgi:hypothetical protein
MGQFWLGLVVTANTQAAPCVRTALPRTIAWNPSRQGIIAGVLLADILWMDYEQLVSRNATQQGG